MGIKYLKVRDRKIKLQIWDTAGQERYKAISNSYYQGSIAAFLVYDITDRTSFTNIEKILNDLIFEKPEYTIVIVGNKSDLLAERKVSFEEGLRFAKKNDSLFFETSAKDEKSNIEQIFFEATQSILAKIDSKIIDLNSGNHAIKLGNLPLIDLLQTDSNDNFARKKNSSFCCSFN